MIVSCLGDSEEGGGEEEGEKEAGEGEQQRPRVAHLSPARANCKPLATLNFFISDQSSL